MGPGEREGDNESNKRKSLYGLPSKAMVLYMMRMVPLTIDHWEGFIYS